MTRIFTIKTLSLSFLTLCLIGISNLTVKAQCPALACINEINVTLPSAADCTVDITPEMMLRSVCAAATVEIEGLMGSVISAVGTYTANLIDPATGNTCWGTVVVEDKLAPVLTCPIDFTISCADPSDPASVAAAIEAAMQEQDLSSTYTGGSANAIAWGLTVLECSDYSLDFQDRYVNGECDGDTIYRTFTAIDAFGQVGTCTQMIFLAPEDINDLTLPNDFDCFGLNAYFDIAAVNRYAVERVIAENASVIGYIETDGTLGVLTSANILNWELKITDETGSFELMGTANSEIVVSGTNLTATDEGLTFDFASSLGSFTLFQNPSIGSGINDWCLSDQVTTCGDDVGGESIRNSAGTATHESRIGLIEVSHLTSCGEKILPYGTVIRTGSLDCDGAGTEWNVLADGNPSPYDKLDADGNVVAPGTGAPGGLDCGTLQSGYSDIVIDICEENCAQSSPSFKVVRQWTILEWCTGTVIEHNQIIKVLDDEAPEFNELPDVTVNTSLWDCSASYVLPSDPNGDNCSTDIHVSYRSSDGVITDGVLYVADRAVTVDTLPIEVYVDYSDCCGNTSTDTFDVHIVDLVPPVVVADAHTVVSLSENYEEGLAKIYASTFDDGSRDNCGPVLLSVRRLSGTCTGFKDESKYDREDDDIVHFCCKDEGKVIMVELQVCDDANSNGIFGSYWLPEDDDPTDGDRIYDSADNCNTAMVEVTVQDKLAPACSVPAVASIDCIDFAVLGDLVNTGKLSNSEAKQIDALFGEASGAATCDVDIEQELTSDEDCGVGTVTRTVTVVNENNGLDNSCVQIITITVDRAINFLTCGDISFPSTSAEQMAFVAAGVPDAWCEANPELIGESVDEGVNLPAIEVMDCAGVSITSPVIDIDNLCSEVGINLELDTFDFAGGGCKKILAHWEIIDQCIFQENFYINGEINPFVAENGYFELYVEYDLFDTEAPVIVCGEGFEADCGAELTGSISASASDNCTEPSFFGWTWKLDLAPIDGVIDYEGTGNTISPGDIMAGDSAATAFPAGTHAVTWIVSDGCGNESSETCEFGLALVDTKAPTPYCFDGLSSTVMLMNGVTLWASDFDAGSFDNCSQVFVSMIPESDTEGLSAAEAYEASLNLVTNTTTGTMEYGWEFDCDDITNGVSETLDVRIYATDASGNYDYCTASFRLQDNLGGCEDSAAGLSDLGGNVSTELGLMVSGVEVEAMTTSPEFPKYTNTDTEGMYAFYTNPMNYNYELTASKNDDYTAGVTTLDLVLIQKHILNIEQLDSPYKLIAADINNDSNVKASDLLQLRKLILGIYSDDRLPNNDSWRFLDKTQSFGDETQPWGFDEIINVTDLSEAQMAEDFMAVKVGDVNGSIELNANGDAQVRSKALQFEIADASYKAGETVEVNFKSSEFTNVYGYQFTMNFGNTLSFAGIASGVLDVNEANFGMTRILEGILTTSFDAVQGVSSKSDEVLFTLKFVAKADSRISESILVNSAYTKAEAYVGSSLEVNEVEVSFREGETVTNSYALFQNEPNPFRDATVISFNLPASANATLKVYDVTGKVLFSKTANYVKGMNSEKVSNIGASGVMYYQINSDDFSATKKMIVIE